MNVINFTVQIEGEIKDVPYAKYLIGESMRRFANVRIVFEALSTDWDTRFAERIEYEAWEKGEIEL